MINKIIRNYLAKQIAGRSDDGIMITLRDPQKVELLENIMADLLMRNGIDPRAIKSEAQLKGLLNQIDAMTKQSTTTSGIRNTESAKVFNIEGQSLDPNKPIIGGTQTGKELSPELSERLRGTNVDRIKQKIADKKIDDDLPPPGSRGGPDDIAAPVQSAEETLKNMIMAQNKENIAKMKQRKMLDEAIDNQSPSLSGDRKVDADLVAEDLAERMGLVYDDMPTKERLKLYDQAYQALTKKKFDPPEDMAKGGIARIGLKDGMNRRTFLKFLAGAASIPIVGKIFKPLKVGKTVTKVPIIKTEDVAGKPEWFDQLVNKVILEGDDVTKRFATGERQVVHMKVLEKGTGGKEFPPGKPGSDDISIMVTQDLDAGAVRVEYRNPENVYGDPVQLQYKKPLPDEGNPRPGAEFDTAESGPVGRAFGPDDYEIEIDELSGTSISDLTSDVSKLKQYATGQKPTIKEMMQIKRRKDKAKAISEGGEDEMQAVIDRQGEFIQFDDIDPGDYASGGIARMLGE
jgi:hypothetical protein